MKVNKVIILFLVNILFFKVSIAQNVTKENVHLDKSYSLYIKLNPKIDIENNENLSNSILQKIPSLRKVYEETSFQLKRGIPLSKEKLQEIENKGIRKREGKRIGLNNIIKVLVKNPTQEKLQSLKNRLDKIEAIEYCHLISNIPVPPPNDIFPVTPSFRSLQNYADQDPGVNMQYAWDNGADGTGIYVRNLEYGFNKSHEELNDVNAFYAPGRTVNSMAIDFGYTKHGTSVIGVLYADNGVYGVTGLVPGVEELILHPEWTDEYVTVDNTYGWDRIAATSEAIANTSSGDVLIYEMAISGGPAELDPVLWDLTKAATDAGIIIVAAAGNGGLNLDSPSYNEYMSRGSSGAIIVGAGTSDVNHDALPFSSYGSRVDLQGWGHNVFTSGSNGAVEVIGDDINQSYTNFNGTSSATAIVASCIVAVQSYYLNNTGFHLTGEEIKNILKNTGVAQGVSTSLSRPIGPLPNMETALNYLDNIINGVVVSPKVMLQGAAFNPNTGEAMLMRDDLRVNSYIPTTSPYSDVLTCDSSIFSTTGTDAIVDWVYVELRSATDNTIIVDGRSALLQRDGDVVATDGSTSVTFNQLDGDYYLAVKHRNHLGIMTVNTVALSENTTAVDFTDATSQITYGSNAQTTIGMPTNVVAMWAGNVNNDTIVQYAGTNPDVPDILSFVLNAPGNFLNFPTYVVTGYHTEDVNMDGNTQYTGTNPDTPFILQNVLAHPGNFLNFSTYQIIEQLP